MEESLPVRLWGVDPTYWSSVKLFVHHLLSLPSYPGLAESSRMGSRAVSNVEIMGVIVGMTQRHAHVVYLVDDGSGVIPCLCWFPAPGSSSSAAAAAAAAPSLYRHAPAVASGFSSSPFALLAHGTVVRVRGRATTYLGQRQITVESTCQRTTHAGTRHAHMKQWCAPSLTRVLGCVHVRCGNGSQCGNFALA